MSKIYALSEEDYRWLKELKRKLAYSDRVPVPAKKTSISFGKNNIYRAVAQEAAQSDGTISCKLADSSGTAYGDAFDVYLFAHKPASITVSDYTTNLYADLSNGVKVLIAKDQHGDYYLISPILIKLGSCT